MPSILPLSGSTIPFKPGLKGIMKFLPATAVPPAKIAECLSEIGRHDPLIVPPRSGSMVGHFRAAVIDGVIAGVGWVYRQGSRAEIDVRVIPRFRKQGVGTGLFEALTRNYDGSVHAGCDAGSGGKGY